MSSAPIIMKISTPLEQCRWRKLFIDWEDYFEKLLGMRRLGSSRNILE
jgi:hypothetical protein